MERRQFLRACLLVGPAVILRQPSGTQVQAVSSTSKLQDGWIVDHSGEPVVDFGPDLTVTDLHNQGGIWYARLKKKPEALMFWLKSYNGHIWGSLDWNPGPDSLARQTVGSDHIALGGAG